MRSRLARILDRPLKSYFSYLLIPLLGTVSLWTVHTFLESIMTAFLISYFRLFFYFFILLLSVSFGVVLGLFGEFSIRQAVICGIFYVLLFLGYAYIFDSFRWFFYHAFNQTIESFLSLWAISSIIYLLLFPVLLGAVILFIIIGVYLSYFVIFSERRPVKIKLSV